MIAILGWGSLIWKPDGLPYTENWKLGGPTLPLEFSRITSDRPLTVVLDPVYGVKCPTRFAWSTKTQLSEAIADLKDREGASKDHIGYVDLDQNQSSIQVYPDQIDVDQTVRQWCERYQIPAAIWTAIPPNFSERLGVEFSVDSAIQYLKGLSKPAQDSVLEYFQKTPGEIQTPLRKRVTEEWAI